MLEIRLLGPLEVLVGGQAVDVPGDRTRAVLARLALETGTVVPVDRLIDDVWGPATPANSLNALQVRVSQLRQVLGREVITSQRPGYVLALPPTQVDALRVESLIAEARRLVPTHRDRAAAGFDAALALWRGHAFGGLGDAPFTLPAGARWEQLRLGALEDRIRLDLLDGRMLDRLPTLEELALHHPLREPLHELLIRGYAALGRQADALRAYGRIRNRLLEELGIDPGPELQALERDLLVQDPSLLGQRSATSPVMAVDVPADPLVPPVTGNLPRPLSPLLHRTTDRVAVLDLLADHRLVTITGPAGVGKTRLAIDIAARAGRRAQGIWFVGLDGTTRPDQAAATLAATLGAPLEDPVNALTSRLHGADALLVIDNCEHLADGPAAVVRELLEHCPRVTVLATSQRPLGVPGETLWPLEPLTRTEAVDLFTVRVKELNPRITFDADTMVAVDTICSALDDLPLAIELAARRCGVLGVGEVAQRIHDRFGILADRGPGRPGRHQTLAAAIGWSYDLLFPDTQLLLQVVSFFPDGAPLAAIEQVAGETGLASAEVIDLLAQLVERSLVVVDGSGPTTRYRVLNSIRAFAVLRAQQERRVEAIGAAHASWVRDLAHRCFVGLRTEHQATSLETIRAERASVDAAFEWLIGNDPHAALTLANDMYLVWIITGDNSAGASRLHRALAASTDASLHLQARARSRQAVLLARIGRHDDAVPAAVWSLDAIAGAAPLEVAHTRSIAGQVHVLAGMVDEGVELMRGARNDLAALGDTWAEAISVLNLALAAGTVDDHATQERLTHEALELLRPHNDPFVSRLAHKNMALLKLRHRDLPGALEHVQRSLAAARTIGFNDEEAATLRLLGRVHRLSGHPDEAIEALLASASIGERLGDATLVDLALADLISIHRSKGEVVRAQSMLDRYRPHVDPWDADHLPPALRLELGAFMAASGDVRARTVVGNALDQLADGRDPRTRIAALDLWARLAPDDGAALDRAERDRLAALAGVDALERPDR